MMFLEASAKTKLGIRQCFLEVVQKILESPAILNNTAPGRPKMVPKSTKKKAISGNQNASNSMPMWVWVVVVAAIAMAVKLFVMT